MAHSWLLVGWTLMHTLQHSCLVLSSNQLKHIVLSIYLSYWPKAQKLLFLLTQRSPFHFLPSLLPLRESWCLIRALGSLEYIWWRIRTYGRRCDPQIRDLRWDVWPSLVPFFWGCSHSWVFTHGKACGEVLPCTWTYKDDGFTLCRSGRGSYNYVRGDLCL